VITVSAALAAIEREIAPLGPERVSLAVARGRTLTAAVIADEDFPPFDTTAMDGYAVRLDDSQRRERSGSVGAGGKVPSPIVPGEAVRVMTGAPIPEGTQAIVPVEDAESRHGEVAVRRVPSLGAHVRRKGEVFRKGDRILDRGDRLTAERILLCATVGQDPVEVARRPRVVIAPTGTEIVDPKATPHGAQIRNGNGPALAAALARRGIAGSERPAVPDDFDALLRLFDEAGAEADLLLTTGGVSAGDYDRTIEAATRSGFEVLFHRVAIKPGKPIAFGRKKSCLWFGLPGNPVSALTMFHVFVEAGLDRFEGVVRDRFLFARLSRTVNAKAGRETCRDARLSSKDGGVAVEPIETRGSHDILAQGKRNALLFLPAEGGSWNEGDLVRCLPLSEFSG
jgi:molybdopterin molybdotransferase